MKRISLCFCIMAVFFAAIGFTGCKQATENSNSGSSVDTSLWPRVYYSENITGSWEGTLITVIYQTGNKSESNMVLDVGNNIDGIGVTLTVNGGVEGLYTMSEFDLILQEEGMIIRRSPDGTKLQYMYIGTSGSDEAILTKRY